MSKARKGRNSFKGRMWSQARPRNTISDPTQETEATRLNFLVYSIEFISHYHIDHHSGAATLHGVHIQVPLVAIARKMPGCGYAHANAPVHVKSGNQSAPAVRGSIASEKSFPFSVHDPQLNSRSRISMNSGFTPTRPCNIWKRREIIWKEQFWLRLLL